MTRRDPQVLHYASRRPLPPDGRAMRVVLQIFGVALALCFLCLILIVLARTLAIACGW